MNSLEWVLALLLAFQSFFVRGELTWYDPARGGINCDHDCSTLGMGHPVEEWYGRALACPLEFPRYTRFTIQGSWRGLADGEWTCLDGGGNVALQEDGVVRLDLLLSYPVWKEQLWILVSLP